MYSVLIKVSTYNDSFKENIKRILGWLNMAEFPFYISLHLHPPPSEGI